MGINFPSAPTVGDLYPTPIVAGVPQYKWDGTAWVGAPTNASEYVKKTGDTMSGDLTISKATPGINLNKPAATMSAFVNGLNNNLPRWAFILGNVAPEGGSNAGSDLEVLRYNDAGTYLGSPLSINRASGAMTVTGNIAVNHTTGVYIGAQGAVNTYLNLDTANYANLIRGTKGGTARWQISLGDGQTESGGNTGNNFALTYWNDAGTTSQSPITADRSGNIGINGSMYLANAPTAASQATTKSYVDTRVGAIRVLALIDANAGVGIALGVASTSDAGTGYGDVSYNFSFTSGTTNVPMISNYVNANPDQIAQVHIPQAAGCRYASYSPAVGYVDPTYYLIHAAGS